MAKNPHRTSLRASDKFFDFQNRKMAGLPPRDDEQTRAEKERLVKDWIERNRGKE